MHHRCQARLARRIGVVLILAVWCQARPAQAQSVGSPASTLKEGQWILGVDAGGLQRTLGSHNAKGSFVGGGHFRGYGLTDSLSLFGEVGGGYLLFKDPAFTGTGQSNRFGGVVLLSAQVKQKLWENAAHDWEWDGSLQGSFIGMPHKQRSNQGLWEGAQLATSVAKSYRRCKPYLGLKVPVDAFQFRRHLATGLQTGRERLRASIGPFFGTDVYFGESRDVVVNLEAAYVRGPEVDLSVGCRF